MPWPLSQDYNEAIQSPESSFADAELRGGQAVVSALGMPMPRSGNFADVYEFVGASGAKWAIKCFTREVAGLQDRYHQIDLHLLKMKLPFTVNCQYQAGGLRIHGQWYPILKMQWVEGFLLNEFVRNNLDKPALLDGLGQIWLRMARRLRESDMAHADLQHGNVLLVPGTKATSLAVKLIDYDGMFVPALAQTKSGEVGHPNYQHPQRLRDGTYSAQVDRFPLLLVATALRALAVSGPQLWNRYDNGDNLLFREIDLKKPESSPLFKELHGLADPQVRKLAEELHQSCQRNLEDAPVLEELMPETRSTAASLAAPLAKAPRDGTRLPQVAKNGSAAEAPTVLATALTAETPEAIATTPAPESALDFSDLGPPESRRKAAPKRRGIPIWLWLAGGATLAVGAVATIAVASVLMLFWPREPNKGKDPIAQEKPPDNPGKKLPHDDKKKPPNKDPKEPIIPNKDAPEAVVLALEGRKAPELVAELPKNTLRACMSADGRRVAHSDVQLGCFFYREAPAFDVEKKVPMDPKTRIEPGSSSLDGKKMTFTSLQLEGNKFGSPKVLVWDWETMKVEMEIATPHQANGAVLSPDMKYLAIHSIWFDEADKKHRFAVRLVDVSKAKELGSWQTETPFNCYGFTPDSSKFFYRQFNENFNRAYTVEGLTASTLDLFVRGHPNFFSADFTYFAQMEGTAKVHVTALDPPRLVRTLQSPQKKLHFRSAAVSPDNRYLIVGLQDTTKQPDYVSQALLADFETGEVLGATGSREGIIGQVQVAANGLALLQGFKLTPCLFRFPTNPNPAVKKIPSADGFVPLFNGADLTGWKTNDKLAGNWRVENGVLVGSGPDLGILHTTRDDFKDFHLRLHARIKESGNDDKNATGVSCRSSFGLTGYDSLMQKNNRTGRIELTGRIFIRSKDDSRYVANVLAPNDVSDGLFNLEVVAKGNRFEVKVNGKTTNACEDAKNEFPSGQIALRQGPNSRFEIHKIDIKELNRPAAPPVVSKRFPATFQPEREGKWRVEGDELIHDSVLPGRQLFFGDPKWADYDFTVDVIRTKGDDWFGLFFRRTVDDGAKDGWCVYRLEWKRTVHFVGSYDGNKLMELAKRDIKGDPLQNDRWYAAKVKVRGDQGEAYLDGVKLFDFKTDKHPVGGVRLETMMSSYRFKNIKVTAPDGTILLEGLPEITPGPAKAATFVPLFNGKNLTGWGTPGKNSYWTVQNGILTGFGPNATLLYTVRDNFSDFHLRLEARIKEGQGGVVVRSPFDPANPVKTRMGYVAPINAIQRNVNTTGTLLVRDGESPRDLFFKGVTVAPGDWFFLDVIAKGDQVIIKVNDKETQNFVNPKKQLTSGRIVLNGALPPSVIEFRSIEIKDFSTP
jgi:hypothetical protein